MTNIFTPFRQFELFLNLPLMFFTEKQKKDIKMRANGPKSHKETQNTTKKKKISLRLLE